MISVHLIISVLNLYEFLQILKLLLKWLVASGCKAFSLSAQSAWFFFPYIYFFCVVSTNLERGVQRTASPICYFSSMPLLG